MANYINLVTPAGRIVSGSVSKPSTHDMSGRIRDKPQYYFALAISKQDHNLNTLLQQIGQFAWSSYGHSPDVQSRINQGFRDGTRFAWKISDGDSDKLRDRPGHAGCMILKFTTTLPVRCVGPDNQPIDAAWVKTGYYADVALSVASNGRLDHTAGIFLNPQIVRLLGTAEEITGGPDAAKTFGQAQQVGGRWTAPSSGGNGFAGGVAGQQSQTSGGVFSGFQSGMAAPSQNYGANMSAPHAGQAALQFQATNYDMGVAGPSVNGPDVPGAGFVGAPVPTDEAPAGLMTASPIDGPNMPGFSNGE